MLYEFIPALRDKIVVLASSSPRRRELLAKLGLSFEAVASNFAEDLDKRQYKNLPVKYVLDNALFKASDVANILKPQKPFDLVIGCDTVVSFRGQIIEKPRDRADAARILEQLSGNVHQVISGVVLLKFNPESEEPEKYEFSEETEVSFAKLSPELIEAYINTGEPQDKAGAYGIQGFGAALVESITGDFYNVVGFPLNHFTRKLVELYGNSV